MTFLNLIIKLTFNIIKVNLYVNLRLINNILILIILFSFDALLRILILFYKRISFKTPLLIIIFN